MAKVDINVSTKGSIPWTAKREVTSTLSDCYRRFGDRSPYKVEVHVMNKGITMRDFLKDEKFRLGINTSDEKGLVCSYDAWRGYPRIVVCLENLVKFNKLARLGAVRHGAAHSALHGALDYYIFTISENCQQVGLIKGIDSTVLQQALYRLSVIVKDFEATRFLVGHDYVDCQFAYALEWLQLSDDARSAWKLAKADRQAKFIYLVALLKPILFTNPLLSLPRSKKISLEQQVMLGRRVEELVEHLGEAEQNKLLQVASMIVAGLTEDTHKNVDFALRQAMSLA